MLIPVNLRIDYAKMCADSTGRISGSFNPVFSWSGHTDVKDNFQSAYRLVVKSDGDVLWDTGLVNSSDNNVKYAGKELPSGRRIDFSVSIAGSDGIMSPEACDYFYVGALREFPDAKWIYSSEDAESVPSYFTKCFVLDGDIKDAVLYVGAMGFVSVIINGTKLPLVGLNPAHTDYNERCCYCVLPELKEYLHQGKNEITIVLADGWRRNWGDYLRIYNNTPSFFGTPCIWASLRVLTNKGNEVLVNTDKSWKSHRGKVVFSHLFDGETYDERNAFTEEYPVEIYKGVAGKLTPMTTPLVKEHKIIHPVNIYYPAEGKCVVDFGTNLSGVVRIKLPKAMAKGSSITIRHAQLIDDNGFINDENLRGAACMDTYIFSGETPDMDYWQPEFTYHGFRYAEVTGYPLLDKEDICAVMICTDLESRLSFSTGNPTINRIHNMLIQTEKSTTHGLFNDTCGRSERMHWLDDGMVRYPEITYNFEVGKIYPHVLRIIQDTQHSDGSITCTAPYIYGKRPGDPLSSSYLLLADELYTKYGNMEILSEFYPSFCAWQNCLLENSTDYIMNYSYYGDWAGPAYSRDPKTIGGGAGSATIPAVMMGTGLFMNNARILRRFANILGRRDDEHYYDQMFNNIKKAFLDKWYNPNTCIVYNGSQSCQALALWLDIIPSEHSAKAAKIMRDDLVNSGYCFTTGVFCLRFMCEMLIKYGYTDEYFELISRNEYPSFGYMINNGATTGWEKYEFLTGGSMNAHIHAFQLSVFATFYEYIAGVSLRGCGGEIVDINPHYPTKLNTLDMTFSTVRGDVTVRWKRFDGKINLYVTIPFNTKANIYTPMGVKSVGSGFYSYQWEENTLKGIDSNE